MRHGTTGSDAKNNPVARQFVQPELNNTELPKRTLDALEDVMADRQEILIADASTLAGDYAAALAFNEEPVTILLHRGREKNAPTHEMVGVNGQIMWIPVDTPTRTPRGNATVPSHSRMICCSSTERCACTSSLCRCRPRRGSRRSCYGNGSSLRSFPR